MQKEGDSLTLEKNNFLLKKYWSKKMEGEYITSIAPSDFKQVDIDYKEGIREIYFPSELSDRILHIANNSDTRLYIILLAGTMGFYSKYTASSNILIGSPIFNEKENKNFINALLLYRCELNTKLSFKNILPGVKDEIFETVKKQNYPIKKLVSKYENENFISTKKIVDSIVLLENIHEYSLISDYKPGFVFSYKQVDGKLIGRLTYDLSKYDPEIINDIIGNLIYFFSQLYFNTDKPLIDIDCIRTESKEFLLNKSEGISRKLENTNIISWFEEIVNRFPNQIALIETIESQYKQKDVNNNKEILSKVKEHFSQKRENINDLNVVTYETLNRESNIIARYLIKQGVIPNQIVAVLCDSNARLIPIILGILKSQSTYLPIDYNLPVNRINHIIKDSCPRVIVTTSTIFNSFKGKLSEKTKYILLDQVDFDGTDESNPELTIEDNSPAYIIYTSGSTGVPKGTLVNHKSLCNYIDWRINYYGITSSDLTLQLLQHFFDGYYSNLFQSILSGSTLLLVNGDRVLDYDYMKLLFQQFQITNLSIIPRILETIVEQVKFIPESLNRVIVAGETASARLIQILKEYNPDIRIYNEYGPTETCIGIFSKRIDNEANFKIIGSPIQNNSVLVIDPESLDLKPVGIAGELCISGFNLARGYLNRVEYTDQKFGYRDHKFFYKTGDTVRYLSNGDIEFIGRRDDQMKIRGFRVEMGEIESCLKRIEEIEDGIIIPVSNKNDDIVLCAYYKSKKEIDKELIKESLEQYLPGYMIPNHYVRLEAFPVLPNGKMDKNALPKPVLESKQEKPANKLEIDLAQIWSKVLKTEVDNINIDSNFFELGGHSLNATLLISSIYDKFAVKIPMKDFFRNPTINGLKNFFENEDEILKDIPKPENKEQKMSLSPAQQRLYIINQTNPGSTVYNMPSIFRLEGDVDLNKLQQVINKLVERHQSLRTRFYVENDKIFQEIYTECKVFVEHKVVDSNNLENEIAGFIKPFNLNQAPLLRAAIFKVVNEFILVIDIHHIIADIVSISILIKEFFELYNDRTVEAINYEFVDYIHSISEKEYLTRISEQEKFWLELYKELPNKLTLPIDYSRPKNIDYDGDFITIKLDDVISKEIKEFIKNNGITPFIFFISLYYIFLYKITGSTDVVIGFPSINRKKVDFRNIVGNFLNTIPIRFNHDLKKTFNEIILEIRDVILDCFDNQDYQLESLINKLDFKKEEGRVTLIDTLFNFIQENDLKLESDKLCLRPYTLDNKTTKFDLSCYAVEINNSFLIKFNYRKSLFKRSTIQHMLNGFYNLITHVIEKPDESIYKYKIFNTIESVQKNSIKNFTGQNLQLNGSDDYLLNSIEENILKLSEKKSFVFEGQSYSYKQFNDLVKSYSYRLAGEYSRIENGHIFILMNMGHELVAMIYALYKVRVPFSIIDPLFPPERIAKIIEKSDNSILVSDFDYLSELEKQLASGNTILIDYNTIENSDIYNSPILNRSSDNLAIIIYTSGSTGEPKGVCHTYNNINYYLKQYLTNVLFKSSDNLALLTHPAHAVGLIDIFASLSTGMTLSIYNIRVPANLSRLASWLLLNKITILHTVPSVYRSIITQVEAYNIVPEMINIVILGGEEVSRTDFKNFKKHFSKNSLFINFYGASEVLAISFLKLGYSDECSKARLSSGKAIEETNVKVIDEHGNELEDFAVGEIVIYNNFLTTGYYKNPELTQKHIVFNNHEKMQAGYKTGDIGRILPEGEFEILGRINDWAKIRGFRIEFKEIEEQMMEIDAISKAAVFTFSKQPGNNESIGALYEGDKQLNYQEIKSALIKKLPSYMIPQAICWVSEFPLNHNGKFDTKVAQTIIKAKIPTQDIVKPTKEQEKRIAELWKQVLKIDVVGITDTFFDLGGDSIKLIELNMLINREYEIDFPVETIFEYPTIQSYAEFLNDQPKEKNKLSNNTEAKGRIMRMRKKDN